MAKDKDLPIHEIVPLRLSKTIAIPQDIVHYVCIYGSLEGSHVINHNTSAGRTDPCWHHDQRSVIRGELWYDWHEGLRVTCRHIADGTRRGLEECLHRAGQANAEPQGFCVVMWLENHAGGHDLARMGNTCLWLRQNVSAVHELLS